MSAPRTHIPQPPHTAGERYKGLRQRIDPAQIPSPIDNQARDDAEWTTLSPTTPASKPFLTLPGSGRPPLATTLSAHPTSPACLDQGNAAPRFVRLTTWNFPNCARLAKECHIPLAAQFQPFADQPAGEEHVPLVPFNSSTTTSPSGPPRCARCRAYINPWCPWLNGGHAWRCNLCKHETPTPPDYFCLLDPNGMRLDQQQRLELCRGAVDFEVGREYWAKGAPKVVDELWAVHEGEYAGLEGGREDTPASPPAHNRSGSIFSAALGGSGSSRHSRDGSLFGTPSSSTEHPSLPPFRAPQPLSYVFALDVSREAVQSGFLRASCEALRGVLFGDHTLDASETSTDSTEPPTYTPAPSLPPVFPPGLPPVFPPNSRLCLLTFDRAVHFYDFRADPGTGPPPTLLMADVEDVFLPFRDGLFVRVDEVRNSLRTLLSTLPARFEGTTIGENAMGSAVVAGLAGLAPTGGHLVVFQAGLPGVGMGALSGTPNEQEAWAGEKEYTLHRPAHALWPRLAERCVQCGVGVSLFLAPSRPVGVGSLATLPNLTGGDMFFHPRFDYPLDALYPSADARILASEDARILASEVRRLISRKTVYDAVVRVRCSEGLHATTHHGAFSQTSPTDLEFGVMSADTAFGAGIGFTGGTLSPTTLDVREFAHIQCAVLYTTAEGSRRVRVLNLALQTVELAANVFHYADMEAVLAHLARAALTKLPSEKLSTIRDEITEQCALMHLGYRERCAQAAGVGQLIIPETLKGLLAHTLGLLKTKPLKFRVAVAADVRVYAAHKLLAGGVKEIVRRCYPRVMALHDLEEGACLVPDEHGRITWPTLMRASHMFMEAHGVYLADNEELQILWVGASASPQLLLDLFGVDDIFAVEPRMPALPPLPTLLSRQVRAILAKRQAERGGRVLKFAIARQNLDGAEVEFADMLVEDENNGSMAYLDYMTYIHRKITHILSDGAEPVGFRNSSVW
ncbi:sec24-related protein [Schizophyllum commune]